MLSVARFILVLCFALSALTGCARRETPVQAGNREQILYRGNLSEPKDLDPHTVTGVTEFNIISALLEGLVGEDPKDLHPVPAAAERWDVSPDGLVYTFHLRPDARWSNGDPVTADDFVFSYRRILSPALGSAYSGMLHCLRGAEAFNRGLTNDFAGVGARATDAHTLELTLAYPVTYFLSLLTHHSWYPVHPPTILRFGRIDQIGTAWTKAGNFVGNGPFALREWESSRAIRVARSTNYWGAAAVRLSGIEFLPIGDSNIEEMAFRAGQLHVTGTIPIDRIEYYRREKPAVLRLEPYLGTYYYLFNVTRPPLNDARVRRALSMAIDREQVVRYLTKAGETCAFHFTPPDTAGYTAGSRIRPDLDEAHRLLDEAGFPGGKGFPKLELLYTSDTHARIAQAVQQMWKLRLGVDIQLVNMEWKVYLARTQELKYDIARAGWIADYVDPGTFLDMWQTGGGNNRAGWSNPAYDDLIRRASRAATRDERFALFQQAEAILIDDMPIAPLYFYRSKSLVQPSVRGWYPNILDHHPYQSVYLETPPTSPR